MLVVDVVMSRRQIVLPYHLRSLNFGLTAKREKISWLRGGLSHYCEFVPILPCTSLWKAHVSRKQGLGKATKTGMIAGTEYGMKGII